MNFFSSNVGEWNELKNEMNWKMNDNVRKINLIWNSYPLKINQKKKGELYRRRWETCIIDDISNSCKNNM